MMRTKELDLVIPENKNKLPTEPIMRYSSVHQLVSNLPFRTRQIIYAELGRPGFLNIHFDIVTAPLFDQIGAITNKI